MCTGKFERIAFLQVSLSWWCILLSFGWVASALLPLRIRLVRSKNTEVLCFSWNTSHCDLQVSGNALQQVEKFKCLGEVFTNDGSPNKEIDTRIGKASAVLRELYCSVVTNRELSNTEKLSVFKSVFVPILTYRHESWRMTERALSQVQPSDVEFLK